jgi:ribosomal protein S17
VDKWKYIAKYKTRIKRTKKLMVRRFADPFTVAVSGSSRPRHAVAATCRCSALLCAQAHDETNACNIGDVVRVDMSRRARWSNVSVP